MERLKLDWTGSDILHKKKVNNTKILLNMRKVNRRWGGRTSLIISLLDFKKIQSVYPCLSTCNEDNNTDRIVPSDMTKSPGCCDVFIISFQFYLHLSHFSLVERSLPLGVWPLRAQHTEAQRSEVVILNHNNSRVKYNKILVWVIFRWRTANRKLIEFLISWYGNVSVGER